MYPVFVPAWFFFSSYLNFRQIFNLAFSDTEKGSNYQSGDDNGIILDLIRV